LQIDNNLQALCKKLYELNKRYKIEYEDLIQQGWVYLLILEKVLKRIKKSWSDDDKLKRIEKKLYKYIYQWKKNPLSNADSLSELYHL
jgi:hypothetical protein